MAEAQALAKQAERTMEAALANYAKRIGVNDGMSHIALREWCEVVPSVKDWYNKVHIMNMAGGREESMEIRATSLLPAKDPPWQVKMGLTMKLVAVCCGLPKTFLLNSLTLD